jgi:hypothetical protein
MKVSNIKIFGLEDSLLKSNYPMVANIKDAKSSIKRGCKLGSVPSGTGHDNFLKGIIVQFDFETNQAVWMQAERYNWFNIVSSQSKMHRLTQMDLRNACDEDVEDNIINIVRDLIDKYNNKEITFRKVVMNTPIGLNLTAGISTNYLQLKTIYKQRKNHKLKDWHIFCDTIETLPNFLELIGEKPINRRDNNE